jgi:hypothetical protein
MGVGINSSRFPNTRAYFGKDGHLKLVRLRQVRRKKRLRFKFLGLRQRQGPSAKSLLHRRLERGKELHLVSQPLNCRVSRHALNHNLNHGLNSLLCQFIASFRRHFVIWLERGQMKLLTCPAP